MTISYFFYTLSNTAFFSSRAFLPAFVTAMIIRFPEYVPFFNTNFELSDSTRWFVSNEMLVILGVLSLLEILADKDPGIQEFLSKFDSFVKSIVMAGTMLAIIDLESEEILQMLNYTSEKVSLFYASAGAAPIAVSVGVLATVWALFSAALVFLMSGLRNRAMDFVRMVDHNNDIGLISLISWIEDFWVIFGMFFLFILPVLTFSLIAIAFLALFISVKILERREERLKVDCPVCNAKVFPTALECQICHTELTKPSDVGLLGFPTEQMAIDRNRHALKLISVKRCPACATRLRERSMQQVCPECETQCRGTEAEVQEYIRFVDERMSHVLLVGFLAGLVPIIGTIFSIIYANLYMVRPFSQYVFRWRGMWLRWVARLGIILLAIMQPIPLIGYISCPIIILIYYTVWKYGFQRTYLERPATLVPVLRSQSVRPAR